jgi:hypothetical protein
LSKKPRITDNNHAASSNNNPPANLDDLVDTADDEQLFIHKLLHSQTKFFDAYLCDFLSSLNQADTRSNGNQSSAQANDQPSNSQQKPAFDGYTSCLWNSNLKLNLLLATTQCNQMLLFDMTRVLKSTHASSINLKSLNDEQFENDDLWEGVRPSHPEKPQSELRQATKMFDLRTKSRVVNLTEYWLTRYRRDCFRNKTLPQFLANVNRVTPVAVLWSNIVFRMDAWEFELLFVGFKSGELAVFLVLTKRVDESDEYELKIELFEVFEIGDELVNGDESEDECVNTDLVR